jgi:short-subunit dehydrogenase
MCVRGALESLSEADVHEILDVDLIAPILLTRSLLPSLRANRGVVVGVSSLAGRIGSPGNALYSAAKFGLDGWLEAMSYELAHVGVSSRVVIPLYVSTAFMEKSADREPATSGPYTSFEQATRARLSGSLETAASPREVAGQLLGVVDEALSGGVGFDRVVLGDPAVLSEHFTRGAADWFEYFQSQVEPWYSSSEPISFCESDRVD